jgi:hypothetical protein
VAHSDGESFLLFFLPVRTNTQQEQELKAANRKESENREGNPQILKKSLKITC